MKPHKKASATLLLFVILVQGVSIASAQAPVLAWVQRYVAGDASIKGGKTIGLDTNGNVFVSGPSGNGSSYGFATLAYSNTGVPLWTNRYDAGVLNAEPSALAVGRDGNVFVTGSTYTAITNVTGNSTTGYSFATIAYSGSGAALWTNSFSEGGDARAAAVAVGQSGTVFVTGSSSSNITTLAYSSAGVTLWTNHYQTDNGQSSSAASIALDDKENVFVAGHAYVVGGYSQYAVVAYSGAGVLLWSNQYFGSAADAAAAMAVDSNGNLFVTGAALPDYGTVACSGAGIRLWTKRYGTGYPSQASAIAVDTNGNIFVTGRSSNLPAFPDYATVAYSAAGLPLWTNRYDGGSYLRDDSAVAVADDRHGHVVVTGYSTTGFQYDYVTIWYSTSGTPLWTNRFNGPANGSDQPSALAVDTSGNVFVTGTSWGGTKNEFATIKYALLQPVPLLVQRFGHQIVLSWTNAAFGLQAAPTLSDLFTNIPSATSPYTNGITGGGQFFRLISM